MDSAVSGPSTRKNLRSSVVRPIHTIDSDSDVQELGQVARTKVRSRKRTKKPENPNSPITVDDDSSEDAVRAPIPQSSSVLSGGDPFVAMAQEKRFGDMRKQFKEQQTRSKKESRVGHQPPFDSLRGYQPNFLNEDNASQGFALSAPYPHPSSSNARTHSTGLSDLFRPPADIMTFGSFEDARAKALKRSQWLMVNIHNFLEFECQVFIRDVIRHEAVKEIIKENFVFFSVNHDTSGGMQYVAHYKVGVFPHLAIIDPRTGQKILTYESTLDAMEFCNVTSQFLADKPSFDPEAATNALTVQQAPVKRCDSTKSTDSVQIIDEEEEEIQRAIRLSELEAEKRKKRLENGGVIQDMEDVLVGLDDGEDEEAEDAVKPAVSETGRTGTAPIGAPTVPVPEIDLDEYKTYCGSVEDPEIALKIRLPAGATLDLNLPNSSQLQAIWSFIQARGFPGRNTMC